MKRFISLLLALSVLLSGLVFAGAQSEISEDEVFEFRCGLDAAAVLNKSTGKLTIKGSGEMNFFYDDTAPWWTYRDFVTEIVVEEGITAIASVAFLDTEATKITLPSTLEKINADAFSMSKIEEIVIPEKNSLSLLAVTDYLKNIPWYKNQPDGPVYLGNLLVGYKGTMPANTTLTVKEGTYAINRKAFYNQSNLVDVVVPDSVERIGENAFYSTAWQNNQPYYQPIYLGKVLYVYNFPWRVIEESDISDKLVISEGIVSVSESAFDSKDLFRNIVIPESLEHIGEFAFYYCDELETLTVPENSSLRYIGDAAFVNCKSFEGLTKCPDKLEKIGINVFLGCESLKEVRLPASVKSIGLTTFEPNGLDIFAVDKDNPYYCTDEKGFLYSKDKTVVYASYQKLDVEEIVLPDTVEKIAAQAFTTLPIKNIVLPESLREICFEAFAHSAIEKLKLPYGVLRIGKYAFYDCSVMTEAEISKTVEFVDSRAFSYCGMLVKVIMPESVRYISDEVFEASEGAVIYCYKDSSAYYFATENNFRYVLLEHPDMTELNALLDEYKSIPRDKYFPETLAVLDEAVARVDMKITVITQETVDGWVSDIKEAEAGLKYLPADYSLVDEAKAKAALVDRSLYTAESLEVLDKAVSAVDYSLDVSNQHLADEYAKAISDAIASLEYLPADYTEVEKVIAESGKIDRIMYSDASVAILDQSISSVDYSLNITQQNIVDSFAERISSAMKNLAYADVILRNDSHGVVVSATAKEIHPVTRLAVDVLDASDFEGSNFAVGGNIRSVQYYDINLVRDGKKVQPDGTVQVKIRIPDGVDPKKCRVYHVVDDPVDPLVRFSSTLDGNYIVFETEHFSEFAVIEVETVLNGISITEMPEKLIYSLNEKVDLSGMEISALFSDGTTQIIDDYDFSNVDTSSIGKKTVTVYYTFGEMTKSVSFEITVSAGDVKADITVGGESLDVYNRKVKWYMGYSSETVQLGHNIPDTENYKISWSSDNSKVMVYANGKIVNKGFFFARSATITLTVKDGAGNVIATDKIVIRFYKFSFQLADMQTVSLFYIKKED